MDADRLIQQRFGVKRGDSLPMKGWRHTVTRNDMLKVWAELGYKKGAEIGVSEGRFSEAMLIEIPGVELMSIDLWAPYGRISQELAEKRYAKAVERLSRYPNCTIMRMSSLEAAQQVENGSLDFVYIDADHSGDAVLMDILLWAPKVRKGGCVAGHDWYAFYQAGVIQAVLAYTSMHSINPWYVTWDREPSWLWVVK